MSANRKPGDVPKKSMRAEWTARRDALAPAERARRSELLCGVAIERVLIPLAASRARPLIVCVYAAFRSEADPVRLTEWCWSQGYRTAAPRIREDGGGMELRLVGTRSDWTAGRWGVPTPDPTRTVLLPRSERPDVVFVPGLAFDRRGGRLGYGGGYYDRLHAELAAAGTGGADGLTQWIGFAYEMQTSEAPLPKEPHDLPLDGLVTDREWIWFDKEES
ncbi:5-formyltetrahydrofolate cyclo-ligase [Cohnella sp. REN36]|uniref:5-formyltetrahydrofolate cyclo-ligase n=1 Tax=Cohnella sp. REN36 TaxID=2887347 RepID=UPI001D13688B|nr:5-formyltetrahydrofolate cyclo-ligase [Cohnella sp. REN36]MCC3376603.1 5-formyltetrahydrofolate cyclo-ligase [Cohnella sp. REN36]